MPAKRPSPMSASAIKSRSIVQLGTKDGEKCTVRFGLSDKFDADKTWRNISVYPPADAIASLQEFDLENDGLSNIVRMDDDDRPYIMLKVSAKKTKCKAIEGGKKAELASINHDDTVIVVARPLSWTFEGQSGVALRACAIIICEDDDDEFDIL